MSKRCSPSRSPTRGGLIERSRALSLINTAIGGKRKGKGIPDRLFGRSLPTGDTIDGLMEIKWWSLRSISELANRVRRGQISPEDLLQSTELSGLRYRIQSEVHQATLVDLHQAYVQGLLQSFGIYRVAPPAEAIHIYRIPADANLADARFLFEQAGRAAGLRPQQIVVEPLPLAHRQGYEMAWESGEFSPEERLLIAQRCYLAAIDIFGGYDRVSGAGIFRDHTSAAEELTDFFAQISRHAKETNRPYPITYTGILTDAVNSVSQFGNMLGSCERLTNLIAQSNNFRLQHEEGDVIPCFGELAPITRETMVRLISAFVERADLPELWSEPFALFAGLPHRIYQPTIARKVLDESEPAPLFPRLWAMRTAVQEVLPRDELLALIGQVAGWEPLDDHRIIVRFNPDQSLRRQVTLMRQKVDDWLKRAGINPRW